MSLYVYETGTRDAPALVFLHGIGASGWMWGRQTAAFTDYHCLNVDLPGHGKSNHMPWVSLADTADQIAAIIRQYAANGRAHVVGLSLGGYVGLALLEHHTDALDHVVISGVTAAPMPNRIFLKPQLGLLSVLFKQRWFANMQAKALPLTPEERQAFTENLLATSMTAYRRIYEEAADFVVSPALRQINIPPLITAGGNEVDIITRAVGIIAGMMPNADGRLAPGLGHGWNVEAPSLFNAMIRAWITDAPLPPQLQAASGSRTH